MKRIRLFGVAVAALIFVAPAPADEGMWLFNMPPAQILKARYGFTVTTDWLNHLMLSSVRFGGASGSFVSPEGLVLTNHHVGQGAIQNLSTKERDLIDTGFYARTKSAELKCSGMELTVLQEIEDVTARVVAAVTPEMTPAQAAEARDKAIAGLEREANAKSGLLCKVVSLYSGGMFHIYKSKVYTDVRLVFAPEQAIAFFGGDPDNFTYPRYDLDITLFRIYENDRPLKTPHYLKWNQEGVKEDDLVFASGHPGSTGRLLTGAQLEFLRDTAYPWTLANYQRRRSRLQEFGRRGAEYVRIAQGTLFGIENSLKAVTGYQSGLLDEKLMDKKQAEESELRAAIGRDAALSSLYAKAWDEIAAAQKSFAGFYKAYRFFEGGAGFTSSYFNSARTLVRLAVERTKPDDLRLREYREAAIPAIARRLAAVTPIYDEFEIFNLTDALIQIQREFGSQPEIKWLFGGRLAEDVAKELVSGTKLKDPEVRKKYQDGGFAAVALSDDPMIKLAFLVDPIARGWRQRYEQEVESVETKNGALIAQAMFKLKGTSIPPDATGTLRLSFGKVKGTVEGKTRVRFYTTFKTMFDHAARHGNKPPYQLPASFVSKKKALKLETPFNFVSTVDSIGGNSGSPVVNRKGEVCGVLFDGNIQSLPARFAYSDSLNRSVMVHSQGILEALRKVYNAIPLVEEIIAKKGK